MELRTDKHISSRLDARTLRSDEVVETYLTATPSVDADVESQAREVYSALRDEIVSAGARVFCERLFATAEAMPTIKAVRREILGDLDDGVAPSRIVVSPSPSGRFAGAQVHAIRSPHPPTVLRCWDRVEESHARLLQCNGHRWLSINGLNVTVDPNEAEQARRMFFCTGCFLRQAGGSMKSVARTWLWLKDICRWYDQLNSTRTSFFKLEGLIDEQKRTARLPASTGIGLYNANGAACTLDLIAMPGREDEIQFKEVGGDQHSAFDYGSAFSRASAAPMPGGRTVFISGTAAIDTAGHTEHIGRIEAQIEDTIAHVRSLLADFGCGDEHVLTSLAYCKDEAVERAFRTNWTDLSWPRLTMIGDVCRPELLFEVEVTASPELDTDATP